MHHHCLATVFKFLIFFRFIFICVCVRVWVSVHVCRTFEGVKDSASPWAGVQVAGSLLMWEWNWALCKSSVCFNFWCICLAPLVLESQKSLHIFENKKTIPYHKNYWGINQIPAVRYWCAGMQWILAYSSQFLPVMLYSSISSSGFSFCRVLAFLCRWSCDLRINTSLFLVSQFIVSIFFLVLLH